MRWPTKDRRRWRAQLHACELLVRAVQSLFIASEEVTDTEFAHLYPNLRPQKQFPSLRALAYARRVARRTASTTSPNGSPRCRATRRCWGWMSSRQAPNLDRCDSSRDTNSPSCPPRSGWSSRAGRALAAEGVVMRLPVYSPGALPRHAWPSAVPG